MSLPAGQQRVLNRMEGALRASEPDLTSMYDVFARLSAGEPVTQEKVSAWRVRWLPSGSAIYAVVLIPVMFAAVIIGSLFGGSARGTATCDVGYSVGGGSPQTGRASCPSGARPAGGTAAGDTAAGDTAAGDAGAGSPGVPCAASSGQSPVRQESGPASRYVTLTGGEQALARPARASSATAGTHSAVC